MSQLGAAVRMRGEAAKTRLEMLQREARRSGGEKEPKRTFLPDPDDPALTVDPNGLAQADTHLAPFALVQPRPLGVDLCIVCIRVGVGRVGLGGCS